MSELTPHKERFLHEVEQKLLRRDLDAKLLENGLLHVSWNEKPLCSVDRDGIVRFRPADITGPEVDWQLRTVIQTAGHVKEYNGHCPGVHKSGSADTEAISLGSCLDRAAVDDDAAALIRPDPVAG